MRGGACARFSVVLVVALARCSAAGSRGQLALEATERLQQGDALRQQTQAQAHSDTQALRRQQRRLDASALGGAAAAAALRAAGGAADWVSLPDAARASAVSAASRVASALAARLHARARALPRFARAAAPSPAAAFGAAYDATTGLSEPTVRNAGCGEGRALPLAAVHIHLRIFCARVSLYRPLSPPPPPRPFLQAPCKKHVTTWLGKCVFKGQAPDGRTAPSEECTKTLNTWLSSCVFKV